MTSNSPSGRCPHCHAEIPPTDGNARRTASNKRLRIGLVVLAVLLLAFLVLTYRYRGQLITILQLANEATGSTALSLLAFGFVAAGALCLVAWALLPFLLAWAWLDLRCQLRSRSWVRTPGPRGPDSSGTHSSPA